MKAAIQNKVGETVKNAPRIRPITIPIIIPSTSFIVIMDFSGFIILIKS